MTISITDEQRTTYQRLFDAAFTGLRAQGFKQSLLGGNCRYRGDSGLKCAAGFLISDERYDVRMEAKSADMVCSEFGHEVFGEGITSLDENFLLDLQECHDDPTVGCEDEEPRLDVGMENDLRDLAAKYGLTVPA